MITKTLRNLVALLFLGSGLAAPAMAIDDNALLNMLVKKGIITTQEAFLLRDEMADEAERTVIDAVAGG